MPICYTHIQLSFTIETSSCKIRSVSLVNYKQFSLQLKFAFSTYLINLLYSDIDNRIVVLKVVINLAALSAWFQLQVHKGVLIAGLQDANANNE